jgi:hypothetical protein
VVHPKRVDEGIGLVMAAGRFGAHLQLADHGFEHERKALAARDAGGSLRVDAHAEMLVLGVEFDVGDIGRKLGIIEGETPQPLLDDVAYGA